jgi:hypothetical protein
MPLKPRKSATSNPQDPAPPTSPLLQRLHSREVILHPTRSRRGALRDPIFKLEASISQYIFRIIHESNLSSGFPGPSNPLGMLTVPEVATHVSPLPIKTKLLLPCLCSLHKFCSLA